LHLKAYKEINEEYFRLKKYHGPYAEGTGTAAMEVKTG
jgi:hypothetical protein